MNRFFLQILSILIGIYAANSSDNENDRRNAVTMITNVTQNQEDFAHDGSSTTVMDHPIEPGSISQNDYYWKGKQFYDEGNYKQAAFYFHLAVGKSKLELTISALNEYASATLKIDSPNSLENAHQAYENVLKLDENNSDAIRGLMKLHYNNALKSKKEFIKKANFDKALSYGARIAMLTDDDGIIIEETKEELVKMNSVKRVYYSAVINFEIPEIAREYENIYLRFLKGKLVYNPDPNSSNEKRELSIAALTNPLEGTFDLSRCGDSGKYLSINTGYRKTKNPANDNKVEIWITPQFLIKKNLTTSAEHFRNIMSKWNKDVAPIGIFWNWGSWNISDSYDYLISQPMDNLSFSNLFEKWYHEATHTTSTIIFNFTNNHPTAAAHSYFSISFVN